MSLRPARGKAGAADLPSHSEAGVAAEAPLCDPHGLPRRPFVSVCLSANCWYSGAPQCKLLVLFSTAVRGEWAPARAETCGPRKRLASRGKLPHPAHSVAPKISTT